MTVTTDDTLPATPRAVRDEMIAFGLMTALLLIVPLTGVYPFFVMQALCFALLACAFNLLIGYVGLLSLGHAMFLGASSYVCAHAAKVWGLDPRLDRHRLRSRRRRRSDQGLLSGSLEHCRLRHHGRRAADQAGRPVRQGRLR